MKFSEYITEKRKERKLSIRQLALYSEVSPGYISQIESENRGTPTPDVLKKLAKGLKIPYQELMEVAGYIDSEKPELPELTEKDERDIAKDLEEMLNNLNSKDGYAAFDGRDIDEMDEEDRELLKASLENSLRLAKRMAKQKFTPKKYRR
ncbi:helix-turn-helix transcriptional regulator [Lentibacillus sp. N15]|uniref:helix-turn-helix domain-containing protein n=1 Tax=Lentibacillus songyuanensis TaxID=3136161 RepID=UPI0031BB3378